MAKLEPKIGDTIVLKTCKHRWLNGLDAKVLEFNAGYNNDCILVESSMGKHLITEKHIKEIKS